MNKHRNYSMLRASKEIKKGDKHRNNGEDWSEMFSLRRRHLC